MITYKKIDVLVSIMLIIGCCIWVSFGNDDWQLIKAYCIVGLWQLLSMLTHEVWKSFVYPWSTRRIYHIISLILLVTMPAGSVWILAMAAGPMALFYTGMCIAEIITLRKNQLKKQAHENV